MPEMTSGLIAASFAVIHVWARRLSFLDRTPRSVWLSLAGGISVGYVFLHLLPELHEGQQHVQERAGAWAQWIENEIYLVALVGLTAFYGLERFAVSARRAQRSAGEARTPDSVFWIHIGSFALYNMLIGYLLLHGERDNLLLYAGAMGLHFVVNDHALREHHQGRYDAVGRWVLAGAVMTGWMAAMRVELPRVAVQLLIALLAGGVVLNVLKEELPEERESRFWAFLVGVVLYGALLLAL